MKILLSIFIFTLLSADIKMTNEINMFNTYEQYVEQYNNLEKSYRDSESGRTRELYKELLINFKYMILRKDDCVIIKG